MVVEMLELIIADRAELIQIVFQYSLSMSIFAFVINRTADIAGSTLKKVMAVIFLIMFIKGFIIQRIIGVYYEGELWVGVAIGIAVTIQNIVILFMLKGLSGKSYSHILGTMLLSDFIVALFTIPPGIVVNGLMNDNWNTIFTSTINEDTIIIYLSQVVCALTGMKLFGGVLEQVRNKDVQDRWYSYILIVVWFGIGIVLTVPNNLEMLMWWMGTYSVGICIVLLFNIIVVIKRDSLERIKHQQKQKKLMELYFETLKLQFSKLKVINKEIEELLMETRELQIGGFKLEGEEIEYCEDPILNTVFLNKASQCKEKARFNVLWDIEYLNMKDFHEVALFSNLIDNAIEGCSAAKVDEPMVYIEGKRVGDKNIIVIKNDTCLESVSIGKILRGKSSKKDKGNHGYGLKIINDIVEAYSGVLEVGIKDGIFQVQLELD